MAQPLQIIVTGESEDNCFALREENLASIIDKIPSGTKVAIVSVVGAFRTGKSFLLNFFLRYLRDQNTDDLSQAWMVSEGNELSEGNMNEGWNLVESDISKHEGSFKWRGGQERQTTGIWMWSEPFIRTTKASGEKLAVLLMDTQGMFDNETTMTLTAQIFGLSTLVSSFQIYNVDKRIQEDNLQHLALFSEYGRMALGTDQEGLPPQPPSAPTSVKATLPDLRVNSEGELLDIAGSESSDTIGAVGGAAVTVEDVAIDLSGTSASPLTTTADAVEKEQGSSKDAQKAPDSTPSSSSSGGVVVHAKKPFQRLQFLVRDWQNFDSEYSGEESTPEEEQRAYSALCAEMDAYLKEVIRSRGQNDLQSTREQITRCFEKLDCFMLPHPGFAVTKKTYGGEISKIEPFFRALVNKYVRFLFDEELEAKVINGRQITGKELKTYFEVYVRMFQAGEKSFPKAMTMLDATAEANNRNAYDLALHGYKASMELLAGGDKPFVKEVELRENHEQLVTAGLKEFDSIATMGSQATIARVRETLVAAIEAERVRYFATNALRNPFKDVELYILPLGIAAVAWLIAVIVNATCSTDFCESTEDTFVNVYMFILFGIVVLAWKQIRGAFFYVKEVVLPMLVAHHGGAGGGGVSASTASAAAGASTKSAKSSKSVA